MKMHGLHKLNELDVFKDKQLNEVIVLLEEMLRSEKLNRQLQFYKKKAGDLEETSNETYEIY